MIRILVTGGNGQLGSELKDVADQYPHFNISFTDLPELDITDNIAVDKYFDNRDFDVVINCAAYTAVDKAESDIAGAMKLNRDGVVNLSGVCNKSGSYFVHISTDYVFDGKSDHPYRENDPTNPQTAYGRSKLAGEEALMSCLCGALIIRTSWLYSSYGDNFVKSILKKSRETDSLRVVSDQVGNPTYAADLARAILDILPGVMSENGLQLYHYSNEGICSWYDFASAIVELTDVPCKIIPIATTEYLLPASRPAYSALDKSLIKGKFGISIPDWRSSLIECLNKLTPGN